MELVKKFAVVVCAGLLFAGVIGSAHHAYAQDAANDSKEASSPDDAVNVEGCWDGDAGKNLGDAGTVTFNFVQNGSKISNSSTFVFEFGNGDIDVGGKLQGSVKGDEIKFKGSAGKGCKLSGSGSYSSGMPPIISGEYKFTGKCPKGIDKSGNISINLGCN